MATQYVQWENSYTTSSVNGSTVADGSNVATAAISADEKFATEIVVEVSYGSTVNDSAEVLIQKQTSDTPTYEGEADQPTTLAMPATASTTHSRTFNFPAESASAFKVAVSNDTGAQITVTVRYKQGTLESV